MNPRTVLPKAFGWFFATLLMTALLSPPGAVHDEWYHATSIWCGQGERVPYCPSLMPEKGTALTNLDAIDCKRSQEVPLICPTEQAEESEFATNFGLYPRLFYFVMSWFVFPLGAGALVVIRVVNALIISALLLLLAVLLPERYRLVLFLMVLTTFAGTGIYLFSSLNPSSWTSLGVGVGWVGLHAGLSPSELSLRRRCGLLLAAIAYLGLAIGSRWDAPAYVAVVGTLTLIHALSLHFPQQKQRIIATAVIVPVVGAVLLELLTPFAPSEYVRRLFVYSEGELDNLAFFSHYALYGVSNLLQSVGRVPTHTGVAVPELVGTVGIVIIAVLLWQTYNTANKSQVIGAVLATAAASLAIMTQVGLVDNRDAFGVEPRYVYPLLPFILGWWFLHGPKDLQQSVCRYLKPITMLTTAMFGVTMFSVAERFTDVQTYGFRVLPEGPDQWWWHWMPFGPNVALVIGIVCCWKFLNTFQALVGATTVRESVS